MKDDKNARTVVESAEFEDYFVIRNGKEFHAWWKTKSDQEEIWDDIDYKWGEIETADHFETYEEAAEFRDKHPGHGGVVCSVSVKKLMSVKVADKE